MYRGVVQGVSWHPQILADQLTLSQPGGGRLCPPYNTGTPEFQTFLKPCMYNIPREQKGRGRGVTGLSVIAWL